MSVATTTALAIGGMAVSAASGIAKAKAQSNAAKKAAAAQVKGTQQASGYMQQGLGQLGQLYSPYINRGASISGTIGRLTTPGPGARFASPGPPNAMPQQQAPMGYGQAMPRGGMPMQMPDGRQIRGPYPMAEGGNFNVNEPTMFLAGEAGPEQASFSGAQKQNANMAGYDNRGEVPEPGEPGYVGGGGAYTNAGYDANGEAPEPGDPGYGQPQGQDLYSNYQQQEAQTQRDYMPPPPQYTPSGQPGGYQFENPDQAAQYMPASSNGQYMPPPQGGGYNGSGIGNTGRPMGPLQGPPPQQMFNPQFAAMGNAMQGAYGGIAQGQPGSYESSAPGVMGGSFAQMGGPMGRSKRGGRAMGPRPMGQPMAAAPPPAY